IQVILTRGTPVYCILQFHSTCVMNFITDSHAFSLYPVATFIHHKAANSYLMATTTIPHPAIKKYTKRGFKYICSGDEYEELFHPYVNRRVGDKFTWIVDLN
ncbi:hypothetical protein EDD85DRAFT_744641, partial [Armillaria nabsnona]